ncbi:MAG: glucose-6-phosphate isomerase [Treponema porcinum]|nr:glucose-6-phosphate isomerase [Treponema porcinum]MCI6816175.1 glucose-6-phosphate isomerase [Treponema porcinum]MCI7080434.1 glucose-6-phosphate isomerase [Treponema porcinum]
MVSVAEELSSADAAKRIKDYSVPMAEGLTYNYAAKQVNEQILKTLSELAEESQLLEKFEALYNGEVVNTGEKRMVLHQLTRGQLGKDVVADGVNKREFYLNEQKKIADFADKVHSGKLVNEKGEKYTQVCQIGIGGSDLGPRAMYLALENWAKANGTFKMEAHFISNVDPDDGAAVVASLDLAHTIFILVSKSGTTLETLTNESFVKDFIKKAGLDVSKHMIAVTSETSPLAHNPDYMQAFYMDDYIGGRYSSCSGVGGAVLSLAFGPKVFADFLDGAAAEDKTALNKDIRKNPALLDALIGIYERNVQEYPATAILPYSQALSRFPAHLQQLDMESNGKSVNRAGEKINYVTGPVIFGEPGTNGQHSFYQLLHQGTDVVPLQFIAFQQNQTGKDVVIEDSTSQTKLCANVVAQIVAFACGKKDADPNKSFAGNRPSSLIYGKQLTPKTLGALLAHFENKVMFQGFVWNINSFDQEGVQLGKKLAKAVLSNNMEPALKEYASLLIK